MVSIFKTKKDEDRKIVSVIDYLRKNHGLTKIEVLAQNRKILLDDLILIPCCICGSNSFKKICGRERYSLDVSTVACKDCGFFYINPRPTPDALSKFYSSYETFHDAIKHFLNKDEYAALKAATKLQAKKSSVIKNKKNYQEGENDQTNQNPPDKKNSEVKPPVKRDNKMRQYGRYLFNEIYPLVNEGSLIFEVGAHNGSMLYPWKKAGFKVGGIEPSRKAIERARMWYGMDLMNGLAEDIRPGDVQADVLFLLRTLEHLFDPLKDLKHLKTLIKPDGLIVVDVPDTFGNLPTRGFLYEARIDHLNMFTVASTYHIMEHAGFGDIKVNTFNVKDISGYSGDRSYIRAIGRIKNQPITPTKPDPFAELAKMMRILLFKDERIREKKEINFKKKFEKAKELNSNQDTSKWTRSLKQFFVNKKV